MAVSAIFDLTGKVALITGGGSGLGRAMAEAVAEAGALPVCFDRDAAGLAATAEGFARRGLRCETVAGDVTDRGQIAALVAGIEARHGRLDILFNNAGIGEPRKGRLHEQDPAEWQRILAINLTGALEMARAVLPLMLRQGAGKIVNTASMWGLSAPAGLFPMAGYAATKGALVNLTRELAIQYAPENIQVNAICPGFFSTSLGPFDDPDFVAAITGYTPMKRLAHPDEIKGTALYLASAASSFVTGTCLVVDGGCLAR